jgi:hypothetical protein
MDVDDAEVIIYQNILFDPPIFRHRSGLRVYMNFLLENQNVDFIV